ncbi:PAS domain S-box-containing protein [Salinibacter ruber]|nr:ATP-binding protein [Salinibacter ruber]MBB4062607.1 PAS domain S-box-containing protein [Salinibacter ruber]MBB4069526.1 PAS domain S-box-containing protein [Salinibacter ruber]MCS3934432.1 PAS domain S-box-containing protein [Salinibacter ruber]MCS4041940.1 PAS domain S-box-containing protein [Salinibacter ruber]MCS4143026.1 PAS domain S-box-containing protein [Salinibacter ruber]
MDAFPFGILPSGDLAYMIYLAVFTAAAAGCLAGAWWAYRRVSLPTVRLGLTSLLLASGLWALCHVGVLLSPGLGLKVAFYEAGLTVGFGTVFAWLWLCSAYSGRALHRRPGVRWAALAVFAAVTLTKLTNRWHGLYFTAGWGPEPFPHLAVDHHVIYWLTAGLSYALAAVGFCMLAEPLRRAQVGGGKLAGLFALTALPLGANAIGYAGPYLLDLSHEPIGVAAFALGALALRGNPLSGNPSGGSRKESCLEEASRAGREERPSLVLSAGGRIQNYNRAAAEVFPALRREPPQGETSQEGTPPEGILQEEKTLQEEEIAGRHLEEALPRLARALEVEKINREGSGEEGLGEQGSGEEGSGREALGEDALNGKMLDEGMPDEETLEVAGAGGEARHYRPVESQAGRGAGRLVVLQDVTERVLRRRERASRLEAISDSMPGLAFEFRAGPGGKRSVEFIGEEAESFLGLSSSPEGFYERFAERVPEGHREEFLQSVEEAVGGRSPWRHEFPFDRPDGERIWLLGSAELEEDEGSAETGALFRGLLLDITRRREAERRREKVISRVTDGIIEVGPEWRVTLVNDQAEAAYGMTEEEMLGRNVWELFSGMEGTEFEKVYREAMRFREPAEIEGYYSGLGEWFDVQVYPNEDGGLSFCFRVITDRKKRERSLRGRREKIEALYEASGSLLQATSRQEVSARIHGVLEDVFGYPFCHTGFLEGETIVPRQTKAAPGFAMPKPEPRPKSGDTVAARALQAGEAVVVERTRHLENPISYGDLRAAAGVPIGNHGAIVIGRAEEGRFDQTDLHLLEVLGAYAALVVGRVEREERLRSAKNEAEEASRMKTAFLANMSHEIRTPLTSILGFADMIGEEVEGTSRSEIDLPALREFAGLIEHSGERLMETLTGVLNLSRLEAGEMDLSPEPACLSEQARQLARELRPQAEEKGLELQVEAGAAPVRVWADEGGLQIVIRNLLSNAIKYTGEGGRVRVRTYEEDGRAAVEVEDTGIGMDPEVAEDLFEPFRQASEGFGRKYEGTGLGLAVTSRATERMEGSIEVDTEKGEGTCFTVWLPQASGSQESTSPADEDIIPADGDIFPAD